MKQVDIIINLPIMNFNSLYSYSIPTEMESVIQPGIRVLVEIGNNRVDGLVAAPLQNCLRQELKPIISVLDAEPVISCKQIELARWMSNTYLCPLSMAINLMVGLLNKPLKKTVKAALTHDDYDLLPAQMKSESDLFLMDLLWQRGEIPLEEVKTLFTPDIIRRLQEKKLIAFSGKYEKPRPINKDWCYAINSQKEYDDMAKALEKRAPQQLNTLKILYDQGPLECSRLRKIVPYGSITALTKKEYIMLVRPSKPQIRRPFELSAEQIRVLKRINQKIIASKNVEMMLYGITGSGKTEVYIEAAKTVVNAGRSALILVPEIALTRHLVGVFSERFENMAVLHSGMSRGERLEQWQRIKKGEIDVVLGTRSAVFAPLENIGMIVVDEEQENTYKQEETPRYHAREVAAFRARQDNAVLLLGSATPSIESFHRALTGEMELLNLTERAGNAVLPIVTLVDLKDSFKSGQNMLSEVLSQKIAETLARGEQTILFLNRRGYNPVTICMECGKTVLCPNCSVALNYHRDINHNVCHYCNYQSNVPECCPTCESKHLRQTGIGTQKIEEVIRDRFPHARVMRMDLDSSRKKGYQDNILKLMREQQIDILIGTQMVAKGLDFPGVSLVGIIDADSILNLPDFRAAERCFQLIVQAAGRAGRGNIPGEVIIQTYNPQNPAIQMAASQDYFSFYQSEIETRKLLHYPPYTNLLRVVISSLDEISARNGCQELASYVKEITDASEEYFEILGPAPCPLAKIRNRYRYQLIVKCDSLLLITSIAKYIIYSNAPAKVRVEVELNPLTTV